MSGVIAGPVRNPVAEAALTPSCLHECPGCGQFQILQALAPGQVARCVRCGIVLRRAMSDPLRRGLALYLTSLVLLAILCGSALIDVNTFGMARSATVFSGPLGFSQNGLWPLSVVVGFMTLLAPLLRMVLMAYALTLLTLGRTRPHLAAVLRWAERLRPWAMIEVFLLGVFVAYTELPGLIHVEVGAGLYALIVLMLVLVASEMFVDRLAIWEALDRPERPAIRPASFRPGVLACECCALVSQPQEVDGHAMCPRCGARLERRKPDSINRTWALVLTAVMLYVPANTLPVLAFDELGSGSPHTIMGGARELLDAGMWPLAALVFLASIGVPCLKLAGLVLLLVTTQRRSAWQLRERTRLYGIVRAIGRWSMIDIFMESVLIGLVQFGSVVTITAGTGAVAFCTVVILTMFAAESFDPRIMWDAAASRVAIPGLTSNS